MVPDMKSVGRCPAASSDQTILVLERNGPAEGRPLVDTMAGSSIPNMKELRPGSVGKSEIRILFAFDRGAPRSY